MVRPFSVSELYNLARTAYDQQFYGDESGSVREPFMSQEQFNALPERQRFDMAVRYTTGGTNIFRDEQGNLVGYGDPRFLDAGAERWTGDPSQIQRNSDGRFSIGSGNVNQDALNDIQNASDRSGFFNGTPLQNFLRGASIVGAGALAGNYFLGSGAADAAGGMLSESIAPQVTETMAGSPWGGGMASDIGAGYLSESVAPQVTESMAGSPFGGSMWQNALNYATSNPLQAARGVGGLLGAATSLGGNQSPQGSSSGYQGPSGPVPSFNPVGAAGQFQQTAYKPMQFDPVPFMGDSTMFQNYSPYGNSGFTGMGMPGQNRTMGGMVGGNMSPGGYQHEWGRPNAAGQYGGYDPYRDRPPGPFEMSGLGMPRPTMGNNQASPVQLPPWMQGQQYNDPVGAQQRAGGYGGTMGQFPSVGSFGKPYNQPSQPPMGYTGSGPMPPGMTGNGFNPVPLPSPSNSGGLLGNIGQQPSMSSRDMQMMARYLPGSGTTVDPNASPNALQNRFGGNFQNMIPQRLQGKWQQFQQLAGPMNSYEDWRNRYPGM